MGRYLGYTNTEHQHIIKNIHSFYSYVKKFFFHSQILLVETMNTIPLLYGMQHNSALRGW